MNNQHAFVLFGNDRGWMFNCAIHPASDGVHFNIELSVRFDIKPTLAFYQNFDMMTWLEAFAFAGRIAAALSQGEPAGHGIDEALSVLVNNERIED